MNQDNYINENSKTSNGYKQLCYRGVEQNSELKGENYGRISSNGFCFRDDRRCGARSFGEINKNTKRKRNFGSGLQGRINDCCKTLRHRRVELTREL